jgi:hypothetical protein
MSSYIAASSALSMLSSPLRWTNCSFVIRVFTTGLCKSVLSISTCNEMAVVMVMVMVAVMVIT